MVLINKKFVILLLLIIISASLLFSSSAGRLSRYTGNVGKEVLGTTHDDQEEDLSYIHERLLRANTKDYGRYDPAPALVKPPFKLIPN